MSKKIIKGINLDKKDVYLLDLENLQFFDYSILDNDSALIIFSGSCQKIEEVKGYVDILKNVFPKMIIEVISVSRKGDNFLDMVLSYYCGRICTDWTIKSMNIISNDNDYNSLCDIDDLCKIKQLKVHREDKLENLEWLMHRYNGPKTELTKTLENRLEKKCAVTLKDVAKIHGTYGRKLLPVVREILDCIIKIQNNPYNMNLSEKELEVVLEIQDNKTFEKRRNKDCYLSWLHGEIYRLLVNRDCNLPKKDRREKTNIIIAKMLSLGYITFSGKAELEGSKIYYDIAFV